VERALERARRTLESQDFAQRCLELFHFLLVLIGLGWQLDPIVFEFCPAQDEFGFPVDAPTLRIAHDGVYDFLVGRFQEMARSSYLFDLDGARGRQGFRAGSPWESLDSVDRVVGIR
jgi:hypothetical protein